LWLKNILVLPRCFPTINETVVILSERANCVIISESYLARPNRGPFGAAVIHERPRIVCKRLFGVGMPHRAFRTHRRRWAAFSALYRAGSVPITRRHPATRAGPLLARADPTTPPRWLCASCWLDTTAKRRRRRCVAGNFAKACEPMPLARPAVLTLLKKAFCDQRRDM
jgi:hypothetical protein